MSVDSIAAVVDYEAISRLLGPRKLASIRKSVERFVSRGLGDAASVIDVKSAVRFRDLCIDSNSKCGSVSIPLRAIILYHGSQRTTVEALHRLSEYLSYLAPFNEPGIWILGSALNVTTRRYVIRVEDRIVTLNRLILGPELQAEFSLDDIQFYEGHHVLLLVNTVDPATMVNAVLDSSNPVICVAADTTGSGVTNSVVVVYKTPESAVRIIDVISRICTGIAITDGYDISMSTSGYKFYGKTYERACCHISDGITTTSTIIPHITREHYIVDANPSFPNDVMYRIGIKPPILGTTPAPSVPDMVSTLNHKIDALTAMVAQSLTPRDPGALSLPDPIPITTPLRGAQSPLPDTKVTTSPETSSSLYPSPGEVFAMLPAKSVRKFPVTDSAPRRRKRSSSVTIN
jgi:hypothetical protein